MTWRGCSRGSTRGRRGGADADADPSQSVVIEKGIGKFDLTFPFKAVGYPFISFTTASGNVGFGQLFFGTTGSLLQVSADADTDGDSSSVSASSGPPDKSVALGVSTADTNFSFESFPSSAPSASPAGPPTTSFPNLVQFTNGASNFLPGDEIIVREVRGTASTFQPGNWYQIKGIYALGSHPQAILSTFVTAIGSTSGQANVVPSQTTMVGGGTGEFVLDLPMLYPGDPHVSFYPAGGGASFGTIYFGTGGTVMQSIPNDLPDTLNLSLDNSYVTPGPISNPLQNPQQVHPEMPTPAFPTPTNPTGGAKSK